MLMAEPRRQAQGCQPRTATSLWDAGLGRLPAGEGGLAVGYTEP